MSTIKEVFEAGKGILQLTPTWVPRGFNEPGHRLRLHPDDYMLLVWTVVVSVSVGLAPSTVH